MNSFLPSQHDDQSQDLTPQELERLEQALSLMHKELSPSLEFMQRMNKRLERHAVILQERRDALTDTPRSSFFSFFRSRVYSTLTAFAFVLFTGSLTTFAYTSESVTNDSLLYPIKRGLESIEKTFATSTPESSAEFYVKMLRRRLAESRILTMRGVVDNSTSLEVTHSVNDGIHAIQSVSEAGYRDQLIDRMTVLLKEEEKKIYDTAGVALPSEAVPAIAPVIETSVRPDVPPSRDSNRDSSRPEISREKSQDSLSETSQSDRRAAEIQAKPLVVPPRGLSAEAPRAPAALPPESTQARPHVFSGEARSRLGNEADSAPPQAQERPKERLNEGLSPSDASRFVVPMPTPITVPLHVRQEVRDALEKNSRQMREIESRLREARRAR